MKRQKSLARVLPDRGEVTLFRGWPGNMDACEPVVLLLLHLRLIE